MNIFENLENLNVSEECFNSIMDIVEEHNKEPHLRLAQKTLANLDEESKRNIFAYIIMTKVFLDIGQQILKLIDVNLNVMLLHILIYHILL